MLMNKDQKHKEHEGEWIKSSNQVVLAVKLYVMILISTLGLSIMTTYRITKEILLRNKRRRENQDRFLRDKKRRQVPDLNLSPPHHD